jgi:hypothetical protein
MSLSSVSRNRNGFLVGNVSLGDDFVRGTRTRSSPATALRFPYASARAVPMYRLAIGVDQGKKLHGREFDGNGLAHDSSRMACFSTLRNSAKLATVYTLLFTIKSAISCLIASILASLASCCI